MGVTADTREERCAELALAVMELMPAILEGKGKPARLNDALPAVEQIRRIANAGPDGITHEGYLAWLRGASQHLDKLEAALRSGDADQAFTVFRDPDAGLHLLADGCEGCRGW